MSPAPAPLPLDSGHPEIAAAIHRVLQAAYRVEAELLGVADFVPLRRTVEQIATSPGRFWGAFVEGGLAAVIEVEFPPSDPPHIAALAVHPDAFRQGLGSALLRHVIDHHGGERGLTVSTGAQNRPALRLYATLDFRESCRWATFDGIPMVTLLRLPTSVPRSE